MAEQQDEQSKRARQKARRQARRQEEMAKARREQTTSRLVKLLALLALLGLIGWFVGGYIVDWRADRAAMRAAEERLDELGCTPDRIQPDQSAGHIEDPAAASPKALYLDRPASSGPHIGQWISSGVYDELIDERLMVHNLEHGYVNAYYAEDAPSEQVEALKAFARDRIGGPNQKMIVAPKIGEWGEDKDFAFVAWRYRQMCDTFDEGVLLNFMAAHYGLKGVAPEKSVPAHMGSGPAGGIDPNEDEGPLLLPPLTAEDPDPEPSAPPAAGQGDGQGEGPAAGDSAGTTEESTDEADAEATAEATADATASG